MKFTSDDLKKLGYKRQSNGSWSKGNPRGVADSGSRPVSNLEQNPVVHAEGEDEAEEGCAAVVFAGSRVCIHIVSHRVRAADPDGICDKWSIDCLHTSGNIDYDRGAVVERIEVSQKLCKAKQERTEIIVRRLES